MRLHSRRQKQGQQLRVSWGVPYETAQRHPPARPQSTTHVLYNTECAAVYSVSFGAIRVLTNISYDRHWLRRKRGKDTKDMHLSTEGGAKRDEMASRWMVS